MDGDKKMFNPLTFTHSMVLPTADYISTNLYGTSMHDRCIRNEACSWADSLMKEMDMISI